MLKTKLILPDGSVLTSGEGEQNAIISANLTQKVNDQNELAPGSVCSNMLEVSVIAPEGALSLEAGMEVACYKNDRCMGLFTMEKPTRASANVLKLTAYDRISRLDRDVTQWFSGLVDWPYRLYDLAWMVCSQCDLELVNSEIPNGDYQVQQFSATDITGRQLMQWIAQVAGRFCRATVDGKLEFAWYTPGKVSVGPATRTYGLPIGYGVVVSSAPAWGVLRPVTRVSAPTDTLELYTYGKNLFDKTQYPEVYRPKEDIFRPTTASPYAVGVDIRQIWYVLKAHQGHATISFEARSDRSGPLVVTCTGGRNIALSTYDPNGATMTCSSQWQQGKIVFPNAALSSSVPENVNAPALLEFKSKIDRGIVPQIRNIQIELGQNKTDYEPFRGKKYTVTLPQKVSSGTYDWVAGTFDGDETYYLKPIPVPLRSEVIAFSSFPNRTQVQFREKGYYQNSLKYEDYQVQPIEKVQLRSSLEDVGTVYPDVQGNAYIVTGNPLLTAQTAETLLPVAKTLYEQLKDITYTPCQLTLPGNLDFEAGQILTVTDANGHSFSTYVMTRTLQDHRDTLQSTGSRSRESTMAVNSQSIRNLYGRVMELSAQVDGLRAENRDAANNASSLQLAVEGIQTQVLQQQQQDLTQQTRLSELEQTATGLQLSVQTLHNDGAPKVKTNMGYRFDDSGLHISKSGTDLQNSVTEKGMYVIRGADTVMLQADANGVIATDVNVRNYLVVGRARFEDIADGTRTACFFV